MAISRLGMLCKPHRTAMALHGLAAAMQPLTAGHYHFPRELVELLCMASSRSTTWPAVGLASGSLAVHCLYSAATAAGQSRGTRRSARPLTVGCLPAQ